MEISFSILPDIDNDGDVFTANILMDDGTQFIVKATDNSSSYDTFRADVFESLFTSIAQSAGIEVDITEDDYNDYMEGWVEDSSDCYCEDEHSGC